MATETRVSRNREMFHTLAPAPFAAAVYAAKKGDRKALTRFVAVLKDAGVRVGGLLQEKQNIGNGMRRVYSVDIATGHRIPLNQPTAESWKNRVCSLDVSALAETTATLRRAVADRVELLVVEKFGDAERDGGGLTADILDAIAAGIPVVVAVPDSNLDIWMDRSGGLGDVVRCDERALVAWWAEARREMRARAADARELEIA